MSQVVYGPRLGREGELRLGCSAVIFDATREKILLTQRADNGRWCLPGGHMESGESAAEACEREVLEETGLNVKAIRLLGVYSNPDQLVIYKDGGKAFFVVLNFEVTVLGGEVGLSNETTAFGWFTADEMETMPIHANHTLRVRDAIRGGDAVIK
mgnify:CR=1 FL=1